jgi:insertion element IS1 protein InsB
VEAEKGILLEVDLYWSTEWDELWSFVGDKSNQRWLWYVLERRSGLILAYHLGRRSDESLQALVDKVAHLPIGICHTDDWGGYSRCLPAEYVHLMGKDKTWKIERRNLNLRTHLKRLSRKTICFSKNEQIHDNVIGMYIERHYFKSGQFERAA